MLRLVESKEVWVICSLYYFKIILLIDKWRKENLVIKYWFENFCWESWKKFSRFGSGNGD